MQNQRDSFIFYRSFYEAINDLSGKGQLAVYQAIANYSLNFDENELQGIPKTIFTLIKPQLNANNKRYLNGTKGAAHGEKGGRPKKPLDKPLENPKKTPSLTPNKNVNVNDNKNKKIEIPDFIDEDLWKDFVEMRVKLKAVNSKRALEGILKKLQEFKDKRIDPNECLEKSIESSWKTVYEPKQSLYPSKATPSHKAHEPSDKVLSAIGRTRVLGELAKKHGCNPSDLTKNQIRGGL